MPYAQSPIPKRTSLNREELYSNLRVQLGRFVIAETIDFIVFFLLPSSICYTTLIWLPTQVSTLVLGEFAQKWRRNAVPQDRNLRLIDVCKFDRAGANQAQALEWMQTQSSPTFIAEFAQKWRIPSVGPSSTIQLIDVCKFDRAAPNQNQA
jgi:hypothetical protein